MSKMKDYLIGIFERLEQETGRDFYELQDLWFESGVNPATFVDLVLDGVL